MNGGLDITVDDREVLQAIERKIRLLKNPQPLLKEIGRYSRAITMMVMRDRRPDRGVVREQTWPSLAESTVKAKRAAYKRGAAVEPERPMVFSGKLRESLANDSSIKVSGTGMSYGTDVRSKKGFPYPGLHQVGDKRIPARRWLYWTANELRQIMQMAVDYIDEALKKVSVK